MSVVQLSFELIWSFERSGLGRVTASTNWLPLVLATTMVLSVAGAIWYVLALSRLAPSVARVPDVDPRTSHGQLASPEVKSVANLAPEGPTGSPRSLETELPELLGREEIRFDFSAHERYMSGRIVLVTGAAGSIGWGLSRQLVSLKPGRLILLDTDETGLFDLHTSLRSLGAHCELELCISDITDESRTRQIFERYRPQVVFHAAAYKHVTLLEDHPLEAVRSNVLGTAILCAQAEAASIERFVFVSGCEAVDATNNLGYSKHLCELLVRAYAHRGHTIFTTARLSDVIGTRGSVTRLFERQIGAGGMVTVPHPEATCHFMGLTEAVGLILAACASGKNGATLVLDAGLPLPIATLAMRMIDRQSLRLSHAMKLEFVGLRPGETLDHPLTSFFEHVVTTDQTGVTEVINSRPVSRTQIEAIVADLVALADRADIRHVSAALRTASQFLTTGETSWHNSDEPQFSAPLEPDASIDDNLPLGIPVATGALAARLAARRAGRALSRWRLGPSTASALRRLIEERRRTEAGRVLDIADDDPSRGLSDRGSHGIVDLDEQRARRHGSAADHGQDFDHRERVTLVTDQRNGAIDQE